MNDEKPLALSIDDDPAVGRVLQLKLQLSGYRVERAMTADEAMESIQRLRPDVIITDVRMPGMSGIEFCRVCEQFRDEWEFIIIVLTSQLDKADQAYVESDPRRRFLQKPFSPRHLIEVIKECREQLLLQPV